ncbi:MAG: peptidylprolyl isomerase [Oscillospiraceae bacterium]|nr:peptidylprolyl isomerase [Oscillospiraceae bacterium]
MSASDKKKLRKEAAAAALTEKQKKEQAEAKKLKAATISFVAIMLVIALTATSILAVRGVNNSGIIDKNTIAAVTGSHELDSVMVRYYFIDHIRSLYQQWKTDYADSLSVYISMMGLDLNAPLNAQKSSVDSNKTWAEYFLDGALAKAKNDLALYDKAMAEGFKLSEDEQKALDSNEQMLQIYAMYGGFQNANQYLRAIYGYGANVDSFNEYSNITTIASAYYTAYSDSLTYNDAAIREYEKDKFDNFSSFSYAVYPVNVSDYLTGGTKDDKGNTTYSDEEKAAAQKKAEEIANGLKEAGSLDALDTAISALDINKEKENAVTSTKNSLVKYTLLPAEFQKWMADSARKNGDITVINNETTTKDADGKDVTTVNGYYVLCFMERNDNTRPLANVRHLLVQFEGGTTDSSGNKTYSDAEKATAKVEAERLLQEWKDGAATEDTFIELVKKNSDDGSKETGGLFEDLHPDSPYTESFLAWSLDTDRKAGDTGVIVSEYGYHVMYYSSDDALTYRDHMITEDLRTADVDKWFNGITEPATITVGKTNRLNLDMTIASIAS